MNEIITPDQLASVVGQVLQTFNHSVETLTDQAALEVGREGAALLRAGSPRRSGKYARTWTYKKTKKGTVYIHNSRNYQLTHLLEKGHKTAYRTGKYGTKRQTRAIPHISTVETVVQEEFETRIIRAIEYQR